MTLFWRYIMAVGGNIQIMINVNNETFQNMKDVLIKSSNKKPNTGVGLLLMVIGGFALCWFGSPTKHEMYDDDENESSSNSNSSVKKSNSNLSDADAVSTSSSDQWAKCPATIERARKHLLKTSCKNPKTGKRFPLCGTSAASLNMFGVGVELYFVWLKGLIFIFLTMSFFALPLLYFNVTGNLFESLTGVPTSNMLLGQTTLANFGFLHPYLIYKDDVRVLVVGCKVFEVKDVTVYLSIFQAAGVFCFCLYTFWFRFVTIPNKVESADVDNLTPADFSLYISGLPRRIDNSKFNQNDDLVQEGYEDDLRVHLTNVIEDVRERLPNKFYVDGMNDGQVNIVNISLVREYNGKLFNAQKQAQTEKKLQIHREKEEYLNKQLGRTGKLMKHLENLDAKLSKKKHDRLEQDRDVVGAYITINLKADRSRLLFAYRWANFRLFRLFQGKSMRFYGKAIRVTVPPEPTNILWENADVTHFQSFARACVTYLFALICLAGSFALIYYVKMKADELAEEAGDLATRYTRQTENKTNYNFEFWLFKLSS